ncbi:MAG: hypothetical protein BGO69_15890 [Bacteroidetes bacterium 46-16]|nr:MAG: hypothetical protein BGO69_15890 [Bacteroidetes bacterium 46-16]
MLYLNVASASKVTVTLYEAAQNVDNPFFTWKLFNAENEVVFTADDISPVPYYYNSFTISVATYSGLTAGIINVETGQYTYEVYEMENQYDLNLSNAIGMVETGILNIVGTHSETKAYVKADNKIKAYKKR